MALKLITLDLDDTVWPTDAVIARAEQAFFQFLSAAEPELFSRLTVDDLRQYRLTALARQPELQHNISRWRTDSLFWQLLEHDIAEHRARELADEAFAVFLEARQRVTPFPAAEAALAALARNFRLVAITNGNADVTQMPLGRHLHGAIRAEEVGASKPSPKLFQAALQLGGHGANDSLHIGDDPLRDIEPAINLGMKTLQARITGKHPESGQGFDHWEEVPTLVRQIADQM